ncbi:MAG TPA: cyclic nucleotide-binding domain-containing protein [Deltaproteobacteria bacterium]|nr:cyclic nucleotide-binding domain-containing protein [Deltaproteobacteria bacterium]
MLRAVIADLNRLLPGNGFRSVKNSHLKREGTMNSNVMETALGSCQLFQGLDQGQLKLLMETSTQRRFSSGETVYERGEESGGTFALIASGRISVIAHNDFVLNEIGPGEIIGEVGVTTPQERRTVTIRATEPTEIWEWRLDTLMEEIPGLVKGLKDLAWKRMKYWNE